MFEGGTRPRSLTGRVVGGGAGEGLGVIEGVFPPASLGGVHVGAGVSRAIGVIGAKVSGGMNSVGVGRMMEMRGPPRPALEADEAPAASEVGRASENVIIRPMTA